METKNQDMMIQRLKRKLKFSSSFIVNPMGVAGGLVIFWNDQEVTLTVEHSTCHFIDTICTKNQTAKTMRLTCLHALSIYHHRQQVWADIRQIRTSSSFPWVCIGDYNDILYHWEKQGKKIIESYRLNSFREFVNDCMFMDIESKGCFYTWVNKRDGDEAIKERLDRALCTIDWRLSYPGAEVFAFPTLASDHSPLLLLTEPHSFKRKKTFCFEAF